MLKLAKEFSPKLAPNIHLAMVIQFLNKIYSELLGIYVYVRNFCIFSLIKSILMN